MIEDTLIYPEKKSEEMGKPWGWASEDGEKNREIGQNRDIANVLTFKKAKTNKGVRAKIVEQRIGKKESTLASRRADNDSCFAFNSLSNVLNWRKLQDGARKQNKGRELEKEKL